MMLLLIEMTESYNGKRLNSLLAHDLKLELTGFVLFCFALFVRLGVFK